MKSRAPAFDSRHLDVRAFASAGASLSGELGGTELPRLNDERAAQPGGTAPPVRWEARGYERAEPGGARQVWLDLRASAEVAMTCQRCLEPVVEPISVDRQFQFVRTEAEAERLDAEVDHEILAVTRELDVIELLEDELLLALPLVPRHAHCQVPGDRTASDGVERVSGAFAALGALRRSSG